VEAGPKRTEELTSEICDQLIELIYKFPQIKTVDLYWRCPEMNYGFKPLVEAAKAGKQVIVRSNLTIFWKKGLRIFQNTVPNTRRELLPLPCYLEDNVDKMRGNGVYNDSIALSIAQPTGLW